MGPGYVESGLVFTEPDDSPIKPYMLTDWFEAQVKRASLPRIRLHDYADTSITMDTYSHVVPALDQDAADKVAGLIFGRWEASQEPPGGPSVSKS